MKLTKLAIGLWTSTALVLTACPGDDSGETGASGSSSGGEPMTTTGASSTGMMETTTSADDTAGESTGEVEPLPEFDCEGADGTIDNNVTIQSPEDLEQLVGISTVTRTVLVDSTELTDLDALGCITSIGENLQIFGNGSLTNVDGLTNVTELGGSFIFSENDAITDFNGLRQLPAITGSFIMNDNDALVEVNGFDALVGIEGDITIRDNAVLMHIDGLKGLMLVGGILAITSKSNLCQTSIDCVGMGIIQPATPPPEWSTNANNIDC